MSLLWVTICVGFTVTRNSKIIKSRNTVSSFLYKLYAGIYTVYLPFASFTDSMTIVRKLRRRGRYNKITLIVYVLIISYN